MSDLHIIVYADNFQLHVCVWFVVSERMREKLLIRGGLGCGFVPELADIGNLKSNQIVYIIVFLTC